ncbi:hypothetical protein FQN50_009449 [Emmonsiellopsis sp. PD_5]|nr:hypothetical protein FQN50_009449 [Emmonsiellopsis sp. PD_5]
MTEQPPQPVRVGAISRKPHTKSRTGCFSCKARRIKCPETRPICGNCKSKNLNCVYPSPGQQQVTRQLRPNNITNGNASSNGNDGQGQDDFAPAVPAVSLQAVPTTFTLDDMRFFHHYMIAAHPYLPFGCDAVWVAEVPLLAHQHDFLMHAILSLAASHLSLFTQSPPNNAAITHRGHALRGLHQSMAKPLPHLPIQQLNAMLATCYILTMQSSYMMDGFVDFIVMVRGCSQVGRQIFHRCCGTDAASMIPLSDPDFRVLYPHLLDDSLLVDAEAVQRGLDGVKGMEKLIWHEWDRRYHASIVSAFEALRRRDWMQAFSSFQQTYMVWCLMDESHFQHSVISPPTAGGKEGHGNEVFLILFCHFSALQAVMMPIILHAIPERARYPLALLPQIKWVMDICERLPGEFVRYVAGPLEVVEKLSGRYGVFGTETGEKLRMGLAGLVKAQEKEEMGQIEECYIDWELEERGVSIADGDIYV